MPAADGGWTTATDHVRLEPARYGDLLKVATAGPSRWNGRVPFFPAFGNITPKSRSAVDDDWTDDFAPYGADDVALLRPEFKNRRFQMIDDMLLQSIEVLRVDIIHNRCIWREKPWPSLARCRSAV